MLFAMVLFFSFSHGIAQTNLTFPIVDTDQHLFYDTLVEIDQPAPGEAFYGQDANYTGNAPSYQDNGDGTVSDLVTGLMWQKSPDMDGDGDIDYADKMSYDEAMDGAATFDLAGYTDWRLPSIKEMYSLIIFSGIDPSGYEGSTEDFINLSTANVLPGESILQIVDILGSNVYSHSEENFVNIKINIQQLNPGIYFFLLENNRGKYSKKFIKK
jgi:hypothetical protein